MERRTHIDGVMVSPLDAAKSWYVDACYRNPPKYIPREAATLEQAIEDNAGQLAYSIFTCKHEGKELTDRIKFQLTMFSSWYLRYILAAKQ